MGIQETETWLFSDESSSMASSRTFPNFRDVLEDLRPYLGLHFTSIVIEPFMADMAKHRP